MLGYKPILELVPIDFSRPVLQIDRPSFESWLGDWGRNVRLGLVSGTDSVTETTEFLPPVPVKLTKAAGDTAGGPDGILGQYGDLGMQVVGRGEMGGAWTRYMPCDPA